MYSSSANYNPVLVEIIIITFFACFVVIVFFSYLNIFIVAAYKSLSFKYGICFYRQFSVACFFFSVWGIFSCFFVCLLTFCWRLDLLLELILIIQKFTICEFIFSLKHLNLKINTVLVLLWSFMAMYRAVKSLSHLMCMFSVEVKQGDALSLQLSLSKCPFQDLFRATLLCFMVEILLFKMAPGPLLK